MLFYVREREREKWKSNGLYFLYWWLIERKKRKNDYEKKKNNKMGRINISPKWASTVISTRISTTSNIDRKCNDK